MAMTITGFSNVLEPILKEVFISEYQKYGTLIPSIFNVVKSQKNKETYLGVAPIQDFQKWNGTVYTGDKQEAYKIEIENERWSNSFQIEADLYEDSQYNIMEGKARGMAVSAKRTRELDAFNIFNHAFDTTITGGDSLALCSSAHLSTVTGVANQSNTSTNSLTNDNFIAARNAMRKVVDWSGNRIMIVPDALLVPVNKEQAALEITESALKNGEISNTINTANSTWRPKVLCSNFLTSDYNWFVMDTTYSKMHLQFQNRKPLKLWSTMSDQTLVMTFLGTYRTGIGFTDWRWVNGANATT